MNASRKLIAACGQVAFPLAILAIAVLRAVTQLRDIDLRVATYAVSSPLGYLGLHLNPEMAAVDWPAGSADFRLSLPMNLLLWIVDTFSIAPEAVLWPYGFVQILGFLAATAYLAHVVFGHRATTIAIVCVVAISPVAGINLGNFGAGIGNNSPVLFYTAANALKLLALALLLRGRLLGAAVALALAMHTHLSIGAFMAAFLAAGVATDPRRWFTRRAIVAGIVFVALLSPLIASVLASNVTTSSVRTEDWVFMSRLFNWHWHPLETGLFGPFAAIGILPLIALALFYLVSRRHSRASEPAIDRFLLAGMGMALLLTFVGILFSEVVPTPVVMKLAPQRSSELITLFCVFYVVRDLVRRLAEGRVVECLLAAWSLMLLMTASMGLAFAPLLLLAAMDAGRARQRGLRVACLVSLLVLVVLGTIETLAAGRLLALDAGSLAHMRAMVAPLWTPLQHLSPLLAPDYLVFGGAMSSTYALALTCVFALAAAALAHRRSRGSNVAAMTVPFLFVSGMLALFLVQDARWEAWEKSNRESAMAYRQAQAWASRNTPPGAVFMGDPGYATGWREYSQRAYFGSLAELAHFATLYDSVPGLFERGLARVREFGVDPLALDRNAIALPGGGKYGISVLAPKVSERFNAMEGDELLAIARRHGVGYLIVERAKRMQPLGLAPVYENPRYAIYAVPPG